MLKPQPRPSLLRSSFIAALAFLACGIGHGVRLVEEDHALEFFAEPIEHLFEPRCLAFAFGGTKRGVGREENPSAIRIGVPCR